MCEHLSSGTTFISDHLFRTQKFSQSEPFSPTSHESPPLVPLFSASSKGSPDIMQGPKLHLPGRQCDWKFSPGDQNFIAGRQLVTCKVGCYCGLKGSEKLQSYLPTGVLLLSCWYFSSETNLPVIIPPQQLRSIRVVRFQAVLVSTLCTLWTGTSNVAQLWPGTSNMAAWLVFMFCVSW